MRATGNSPEIREETIRGLLAVRPPEAHKGAFGHVAILAGSPGFTGAAKLTACGALRSGAGLVTVGVAASLVPLVAPGLTEAMYLALPEAAPGILGDRAAEAALAFLANKQALVLGPGLGQHDATRGFVSALLERVACPLVLDADGLNLLSRDTAPLATRTGPTVITPHPGEMARLIGKDSATVQAARESVARDFAKAHGCIVVLKGHRTIVADPDGDVRINTTGNSGMATGGTGDVLAGLLGGLLAQGMPPRDAALVAVYVHGLAGDLAADAKTQRGMTALDLAEALPAAWRRLEGGRT